MITAENLRMNKFNNKAFELIMGASAEGAVRMGSIAFAVVGFFLHLLLWVLHTTGRITVDGDAVELVRSPLSTLYTPFSILLIYEVYQLIRAIPESFSSSIGKQFEVATLLVVRDLFKRLSDLESSSGWVISEDLGFFLIESATFLTLFYTSLCFYRQNKIGFKSRGIIADARVFIGTKRLIANLMLIVFLVTAVFSFWNWALAVQAGGGAVSSTIFFLDFFTFLILADILILLISYWTYTDFENLARNTGFVLSTVVIRVAISSEGVTSMLLFTLSSILGIAIIKMFAPVKAV
jgi:hypothetical protein